MRAEAGSVGRREWLDGEALVEQTLVVYLLEEIPEGLDVPVVIGDVRVIHIDPVAYPLGHVHPLAGVLHHLLAAGAVVLLYADFLSDVLFVDAEFLLHTYLHWETVGVPSGATCDLVSRLGLVTAYGVLDGAGHHVMDARLSVSRRRTFEEYEFRRAFPYLERFPESVHLLPPVQNLRSYANQIQSLILFECHIFSLFLQAQNTAGLSCKYTNFVYTSSIWRHLISY